MRVWKLKRKWPVRILIAFLAVEILLAAVRAAALPVLWQRIEAVGVGLFCWWMLATMVRSVRYWRANPQARRAEDELAAAVTAMDTFPAFYRNADAGVVLVLTARRLPSVAGKWSQVWYLRRFSDDALDAVDEVRHGAGACPVTNELFTVSGAFATIRSVEGSRITVDDGGRLVETCQPKSRLARVPGLLRAWEAGWLATDAAELAELADQVRNARRIDRSEG